MLNTDIEKAREGAGFLAAGGGFAGTNFTQHTELDYKSQVYIHAEAYIEKGMALFPIHGIRPSGSCTCSNSTRCSHPGKHPLTIPGLFENGVKGATKDLSKIREALKRHPNMNLGVATGAISNLTVLDVDGEEGYESLDNLELPGTIGQRTGSGGKHLFFAYRSDVASKVRGLPGLDTRGDGGYIVVAPSIHKSGGEYELDFDLSGDDFFRLPQMPDEVAKRFVKGGGARPLPIAKKAPDSGFSGIPADLLAQFEPVLIGGTEIPKGGRNDSLFRMASAMRGEGMELDEIAGELLEKNANLCKPPLNTSEVMTIVESAGKYPAGDKKAPQVLQAKPGISVSEASGVTELAMAKAISETYGGRFHHVSESGKFYILEQDTGLWIEDFSGWLNRQFFALLQDGKEMAFALIRQRNDSGNKLLSAIMKAEKNNFISGAMSLLKALPSVTVRQNQFDANPLLVGFSGGKCADLKTGEIRQIRPDDYLTKTLGTNYNDLADCPTWERCMSEWTRNDADLVKFLQIWMGYTLSGLTEFQGLLFLFGGGANGKSVFISILTILLGDYARTLPAESLMMKGNDSSASNDVARLAGARLAVASELPEGRIFDENRIKSLTGGDMVSARFLYGEYFDFRPCLKLAISGNHKPVVRGNDNGIWRRIHLVPFLANVANPDPDLTSKLKKELPGILNWALKGWELYQKEGLNVPECVKRESAGYRQEMDIIGQWLEQKTEPLLGNKIASADFYANFKEWAISNGFHTMNSSAFGRKLEGRVMRAKSGGIRYYVDLKLRY